VRLLLVQATTGTDPAHNRDEVREAVSAGLAASGPVDLVVLPEAVQADFGSGEGLDEVAEPLDGPFTGLLGELAAQSGAVVVGGMFEAVDGALPFNTLVAVEPSGRSVATYRKTHLYDAFGYRESDRLSAGEVAAVTLDVLGRDGQTCRVGLSTCYDLRFPEQSRSLVDAGADLLVVPAAWLRGPSKEHHWTTLLAARAIENTVYVAGVAKSGPGYCGLTRLVDPMGLVVAGLGEQDGSLVGHVDPARIAQVREMNPSLANRRWSVTPGRPPSGTAPR
jgi:predicted amidohydrolase